MKNMNLSRCVLLSFMVLGWVNNAVFLVRAEEVEKKHKRELTRLEQLVRQRLTNRNGVFVVVLQEYESGKITEAEYKVVPGRDKVIEEVSQYLALGQPADGLARTGSKRRDWQLLGSFPESETGVEQANDLCRRKRDQYESTRQRQKEAAAPRTEKRNRQQQVVPPLVAALEAEKGAGKVAAKAAAKAAAQRTREHPTPKNSATKKPFREEKGKRAKPKGEKTEPGEKDAPDQPTPKPARN